MNECKKALQDYLEIKKLAFPRFEAQMKIF